MVIFSFNLLEKISSSCHLVLGEFQEAMQYYNECLGSGNRLCLDRRFTIEAANGLHRAQVRGSPECELLSHC